MELVLTQLAPQHELLNPHWARLSEAELAQPLAAGRWSRKQILGHLIDSAVNNQRRFVQAQFGPWPYELSPYDQDQWVHAGGYAVAPSPPLLTLWNALNQQLARLIGLMPNNALACECRTPDGRLVTLEWLVQDYVMHLTHHVQQILAAE